MEDSSECLADSALFAERASSLDSLSIFMSELSLKNLDSIAYRLLNFRVTRHGQFLMLPGQVFFDFRFALVDLTASPDCSSSHLSFLSSPSSAQRAPWRLGDPRGVKRLIIN